MRNQGAGLVQRPLRSVAGRNIDTVIVQQDVDTVMKMKIEP